MSESTGRSGLCVYYCRTYYKGTVKDMCYEVRRAEACVDRDSGRASPSLLITFTSDYLSGNLVLGTW